MSVEANAIFRAFARSVRRAPNAEAIRFRDRRWSYADLHGGVASAAAWMTQHGVHAGDRVAFLGRNSDAYAIGFLATQMLGAIHVPINFMLGAGEVAFILDHASPRIVFADAEFAQVARDAAVEVKPAMLLEPLERLATLSAVDATWDLGAGSDTPLPAQLAYTSGTESAPKGALLSDVGLVHEYMSCIEAGEYSGHDVSVHALPLYHCAQMHCFLLPSLLLGARNIILDRADPGEIARTVREHGATSFFAPPTVWIGILGAPGLDAEDLRSLSKGYYGASIMPGEVLRRMRETLPWLRLWNYYGQTEIGPLATVLRPDEHEQRPASAGRPVLFVETRIVDDAMHDTPRGKVGEIVHRSPQLLLRYYRDPGRTAAAFEGGWFHSGDLGVMDDAGYITVVDRKKDMIKTGGENVASREVEEAVYLHRGVGEVAVIGLPDDKWVERVCAVVVMKHGEQAAQDDIIAATSHLAPFKRPKQVVFVDQLPKNPSGKVLKRQLRESLAH